MLGKRYGQAECADVKSISLPLNAPVAVIAAVTVHAQWSPKLDNIGNIGDFS